MLPNVLRTLFAPCCSQTLRISGASWIPDLTLVHGIQRLKAYIVENAELGVVLV